MPDETSNNTTPADPNIRAVAAQIDLNRLLRAYPWETGDGAEQAAAKILGAIIRNEETAGDLATAVIEHRQSERTTSNAQADNEMVDTLLRAAEALPVHEYFTDDHIYADRAAYRNGLTTQHWLAALRELDQADADTHSDGYTVTVWHLPERQDADFAIRATHRHWWLGDEPHHIKLTAYRMADFTSETEPGDAAGTAIVLWPWI